MLLFLSHDTKPKQCSTALTLNMCHYLCRFTKAQPKRGIGGCCDVEMEISTWTERMSETLLPGVKRKVKTFCFIPIFLMKQIFFFFKETTTKKCFCSDLCCFFIRMQIWTIYLRAESLGFLMKKKSAGCSADLQHLHAATSVTWGSLCVSGNNILISWEGYGDLWGTCFSLEGKGGKKSKRKMKPRWQRIFWDTIARKYLWKWCIPLN